MQARWTLASVLMLLAASATAADRGDRHPRITNGVFAWDPPSVGALLCGVGAEACVPDTPGAVPDPDAPLWQWCTGTMIGCRTFVTAAHCLCHGNATYCHDTVPRDPANWRVFLQHGGIFELESVHLHPEYRFLGFPSRADVAVVKLARDVTGISPAAINDIGSPPLGTPGTIVGFGQEDLSSYWGLKRSGAVVTGPCPPGASRPEELVCWTFEEPVGPPGSDSNTCFGDSGGPLFVDLGSGPVLADVTSNGTNRECTTPSSEVNPDLFVFRDFLIAEAGDDLGATCGDLAPVGHPRTMDHGFTGTLGPAKPEARHSFEVGAGAEVLRIALNALDATDLTEEVGLIEFDLYAKLGAPAQPDDFDCALDEFGQNGFCELEAPTPGTWHVLVSQVEGEGEYQVTATALPEPGRPLLLAIGAGVLALARRRRGPG